MMFSVTCLSNRKARRREGRVQPPQLRTLAQISADILALEHETDGLLQEITKGVAR